MSKKTTAEVTPAYGMRSVGGFGLRGWRVFCPDCGFLSPVFESTRFAPLRRAQQHRCSS